MDLCFGDNYYNDTRIGVHQKVWTGEPTDYRGRLVIDDPSGTNVVLPTARNSLCGDRGCKVPLYYSTDSGKTFKRMVYMNNSFDPSRDSEGYMIAATKDALYIARS
ncbi:T6SS immunity protein Tli3 family protein, partial [Caballeronia sp.]|uniref:T6SS immunity protein Tli3 family protein n=1 Tax=Caballeronia sp. TaxID=1931223 RepID=UPI003C516ECE